MPQFYHLAGGGRSRGISLAIVVAVGLAALNAGEGATATDIALFSAIALVATGIIGLGTYLLVRAARPRPIAPPPPAVHVTVTVIRVPEGAVPRFPTLAIQGEPPGKFLALPADGGTGTAS